MNQSRFKDRRFGLRQFGWRDSTIAMADFLNLDIVAIGIFP